MRFSADGRLVFAGCDDQRLYVWDIESGKTIHISDKFKYPLVSLAVSPEKTQIAIGCEPRNPGSKSQCFLFDQDGQRLIKSIPTHGDYTSSLDYSSDGRWLAQASGSAYSIWDTFTGNRVHHFDVYGGSAFPIQCIRFSPDNDHVAEWRMGEVKLWKITTGDLIRNFTKIKSSRHGCGIAFSQQLPILAIACKREDGDTKILLIDVKNGQQLHKLPLNTWQGIDAISFSSAGHFLAAGSNYSEPVLCIYSQK